MKRDIIIAGVGGQGILTIASVINSAAMLKGFFVKQAEVRGMSQRGGAVHSHVRFSEQRIHSDTIPLCTADIIISMELTESLRHIPWLSDNGIIITSLNQIKTAPEDSRKEIFVETLENSGYECRLIDTDTLSEQAGNRKLANVILIGAASKHLGIEPELLEQGVERVFSEKGDDVLNQNLMGFAQGQGVQGSTACSRGC